MPHRAANGCWQAVLRKGHTEHGNAQLKDQRPKTANNRNQQSTARLASPTSLMARFASGLSFSRPAALQKNTGSCNQL